MLSSFNQAWKFGFQLLVDSKERWTSNSKIYHPYTGSPVHSFDALFFHYGCHNLCCGSILRHQFCFNHIERCHDKSGKWPRDWSSQGHLNATEFNLAFCSSLSLTNILYLHQFQSFVEWELNGTEWHFSHNQRPIPGIKSSEARSSVDTPGCFPHCLMISNLQILLNYLTRISYYGLASFADGSCNGVLLIKCQAIVTSQVVLAVFIRQPKHSSARKRSQHCWKGPSVLRHISGCLLIINLIWWCLNPCLDSIDWEEGQIYTHACAASSTYRD